MTRPPSVRATRSLRLRLLLASVVVEVVMLTALVANGARLISQHLMDTTSTRVAAQEASFNITLAGLLASRDYATLQSVLDGWGGINAFTYMAVADAAGRRVAASGDVPVPLPALAPLSYETPIYHGGFDVTYLGQRYGIARYGLDTTFLLRARQQLIEQSFGIAAVEVLLTVAMLTAIGFWLTRHLNLLAQAAMRVAHGDFSHRIEYKGSDEISLVGSAFNKMSEAIRARISDLDESQRRFRAIADYTHAWETWFDTGGRLRWVNPAVERITGRNPAECQAMDDFPLPMVVPEDREAVVAHLAAGQAGESGRDVEFRVRHRNGSTLWVAMSWQPIFDGGGQSLGFRASIRDISQQKRASDLLLEAKAELERMLFAASHDLQEPARSILTFSQKLAQELAADQSEKVGADLAVIQDASRQMALLVRGLSEYNRSSQPMAAFAPTDLARIIGQVIADCQAMGGGTPPHFEIGSLPTLTGDPVLLAILFHNLIGNALQYAKPGIPPEVRVSATPEAGGWRIDIADNGIGIAPEYIQTIIRPFSRLHSRSTFPGAGLGLASAMKVAKVHGGHLSLDSTPNVGTTVHVWLPSL